MQHHVGAQGGPASGHLNTAWTAPPCRSFSLKTNPMRCRRVREREGEGRCARTGALPAPRGVGGPLLAFLWALPCLALTTANGSVSVNVGLPGLRGLRCWTLVLTTPTRCGGQHDPVGFWSSQWLFLKYKSPVRRRCVWGLVAGPPPCIAELVATPQHSACPWTVPELSGDWETDCREH